MSNGSTFVSTHCWANNVCQFDLGLNIREMLNSRDTKSQWKTVPNFIVRKIKMSDSDYSPVNRTMTRPT